MATEALIAHMLISKFADHLPLYRQAQIFSRQGIVLDRSTLGDWIGRACWWLCPGYDRVVSHIMAAEKIFADDTGLPVLDPGRVGPRPVGSGAMRSMTGHGVAAHRRRAPMFMPRTARGYGPPRTSPTSAALCRWMAIPGSDRW